MQGLAEVVRWHMDRRWRASDGPPCDHGVKFDPEAARILSPEAIRQRWPRFFGECACGYHGIAYASWEHFIAGDW